MLLRTFESAGQLDYVVVVEFAHALDLLLDVFDEVRLFRELLLVDTLDGVDLVVG